MIVHFKNGAKLEISKSDLDLVVKGFKPAAPICAILKEGTEEIKFIINMLEVTHITE